MESTNDIIVILDDHGFLDTDTTTKVAFINDAIADFCAREAWPFLEAEPVTLTFDGSSGTPDTGMPDNLRAVVSVIDLSTGRTIAPERIDNLEKRYPLLLTQTGNPPGFYYFIGTELHFAGIPPSDFTARLRYIQYHPQITSDSVLADFLIPQRFWMTIVFGALIRLYDLDDDPETSARFEQHFESRIAAIRSELWQRQFDRSDTIVITDPDYLPDYPY